MLVQSLNTPVVKYGISYSRLILAVCLLDLVPVLVVILNYLGIDLSFMVNLTQICILSCILVLIRWSTPTSPTFIVLFFIIIFISVFKMLAIPIGLSTNFKASAIGPYFFSIIMPFVVFVSIFSQDSIRIKDLKKDLEWFAVVYAKVAGLLILVYAALNFSGVISYFGLGVNLHYVIPFFLSTQKGVVSFAVLILLTGKRALLLNFLIQLGIFFSAEFKKKPLLVLCFFIIVALGFVALGDGIQVLLRRFILMYEVINHFDWSGGIQALANSYETVVLFGGRLEEVIGVYEYFQDHPNQIWFGSPPGANYIWNIGYLNHYEYKSFTHFTWISYIFRYGIIPTFLLMASLVFYLIRGAGTSNPLWLVYIGILSSATFGANLLYQPTAWVLIALYARYGKELTTTHQ